MKYLDILPRDIVLKISKDGFKYSSPSGLIEKPLPFDIDNLHKQLEVIDFNKFYNSVGGKHARNEILENLSVMPLVFPFYMSLCKDELIPSPQYLCEKYIESYCIKIENDKYCFRDKFCNHLLLEFSKDSLFGRMCRAYNSFNREVELLFQLFKISPKEFNVYYSIQDDFYNGIDIMIKYNDNLYAIISYMSSSNSFKYRAIKEHHRQIYKDVGLIPVVATFSGIDCNTVDCGDVRIYEEDTAQKIVDTILGKSEFYNIKWV